MLDNNDFSDTRKSCSYGVINNMINNFFNIVNAGLKKN